MCGYSFALEKEGAPGAGFVGDLKRFGQTFYSEILALRPELFRVNRESLKYAAAITIIQHAWSGER
jgi:hypothetical protein